MNDEVNILPTIQSIDPNLFSLNWDIVIEVLAAVVILSLILERALALLFESAWYVKWNTKRKATGKATYKPLIAFLLGATGCVLWQFDAISIILVRETTTVFGSIITGAVVAGGSKGSIKLFRDILKWRSSVYEEALEQHKASSRIDANKSSSNMA